MKSAAAAGEARRLHDHPSAKGDLVLKRSLSWLFVPVLLLLFITPATSAVAAGRSSAANAYRVRPLVSDLAGAAAHRDRHLVNAWGLAAGPSTPWWVADNGTDVSTLYDDAGNLLPLVVHVGGGPTGTVFNGSSDFVVHRAGASGPALFLFATEAGTIRGWSPGVPAPIPSTRSFTVVNRSGTGAIFKGLAIANTAAGSWLYATDFHNGRVDMFDGGFHQVMRHAFVDPNLPDHFAPFGVANLGGRIVVTYAKQDAAHVDDVQAPGLGFVDMFNLRGAFLERVASRGALNAPWGLAWAPSSYGRFGGDLLVGNFGDGRINAYNLGSGAGGHDGVLRQSDGRPVWIDGLWALAFGNGGPAGSKNALFFTAGPADESHGLFGKITLAG